MRWARAGLEATLQSTTTDESVIAMLEADGGDLLSFALITAVAR